ncbi:hypothetical protein FPF71_14180 [Algibacter amylolyticus]|uniref:Uncharacterized protein n=1 Tax=Algibacter amylolyticus TaxID=1608400 RepID=A0A5M7B243_9FLAO|nr:hypothetical protein [Algibacter amylolyticus]KAA5822297.1 hypothetical protein F2B50_14180 [Algibacter amylolyticus]MBB5269009.1 hypothetical protein [Algibacter amylolyticus]TSJ73447.1 hypothetical protein FPF71_14180 [Algibacter amylolyticus]
MKSLILSILIFGLLFSCENNSSYQESIYRMVDNVKLSHIKINSYSTEPLYGFTMLESGLIVKYAFKDGEVSEYIPYEKIDKIRILNYLETKSYTVFINCSE